MSDEPPPPTRRERTLELDRVVNFSDGVFAIAMTLLVLSLHVPLTLDTKYSGQALDTHLWHEFRDVLPNLFGYALSFAVISRTWLAHHRAFRVIERIDHTFIDLNLMMLAFVALAPFPTEVFGAYPQSRTATVVYAASIERGDTRVHGTLALRVERRSAHCGRYATRVRGALDAARSQRPHRLSLLDSDRVVVRADVGPVVVAADRAVAHRARASVRPDHASGRRFGMTSPIERPHAHEGALAARAQKAHDGAQPMRTGGP